MRRTLRITDKRNTSLLSIAHTHIPTRAKTKLRQMNNSLELFLSNAKCEPNCFLQLFWPRAKKTHSNRNCLTQFCATMDQFHGNIQPNNKWREHFLLLFSIVISAMDFDLENFTVYIYMQRDECLYASLMPMVI